MGRASAVAGAMALKQQNSVEGSVDEGVAVIGRGCLGRGRGGTRQNSCMCVACVGNGCISGLGWGFIAQDGVLVELEIRSSPEPGARSREGHGCRTETNAFGRNGARNQGRVFGWGGA